MTISPTAKPFFFNILFMENRGPQGKECVLLLRAGEDVKAKKARFGANQLQEVSVYANALR